MSKLDELFRPGVVAFHIAEYPKDRNVVIFKYAARQYYIVDLKDNVVIENKGPFNKIMHYTHGPNGENVQPPADLLNAAMALLNKHKSK